ncbi:DUF6624 domain-containing protein [Chryseobacterium sp.]|uniref:DUF6624 domain-containing protein n=1 Tax=Chryseobacterium sp. TaxID=1871047 RepID=UPI0025B81E41|nr:DUF6624 domain-containing protein [Chryseobacterium sp.]MBV8327809.1 hypothetical protein [Chryseobacterium sp.]
MNDRISEELIELANRDLSMREELAEKGALSGGYHPEMEQIHKANAKRLREMIKEIGFPTISKVGEVASDAAWLIIQHAIGEPEFMKTCYAIMEEHGNDINPRNKAYLYDRIQVFQSKPQKYGTQLTSDGRIYPVENKKYVNREREKVSLPLLSDKKIKDIPEPEDIPEIDSREEDYIVWRRKMGWIE